MFLFISIICSIGVLCFFFFTVLKADFYNTYTSVIGVVLSVVVSLFVFVGMHAIKEENSIVYKNKSSELNQYFWACDKLMINPMAEIVEVKHYRDSTWAITHSMYRQFEVEYCSELEKVKK